MRVIVSDTVSFFRRGEIFDFFYATKAEGVGIGLAVSRPIIRTLGGGLRAELASRAARHFDLHHLVAEKCVW